LLRCGLIGANAINGGTGFNLSSAYYSPFGPDSPACRASAMQPAAQPASPVGHGSFFLFGVASRRRDSGQQRV